jgi:uncharacterized membrane protein YczE
MLYGISEALMLSSAVGVDPWDVLHTGLARVTGISVGTVLIIVGAAVLLLWIPMRQRPGLGTLANVAVIGAVVDLVLGQMPALHALWERWGVFAAGVLLNAISTGLYIGAGLGAGPRDGLTTGYASRGHSIRAVRTTVELSALAAGWLLGGDVGLGTLVYALAIGPLVHVTIPWFGHRPRGLHRPPRSRLGVDLQRRGNLAKQRILSGQVLSDLFLAVQKRLGVLERRLGTLVRRVRLDVLADHDDRQQDQL